MFRLMSGIYRANAMRGFIPLTINRLPDWS
jgi:hypothetical protein